MENAKSLSDIIKPVVERMGYLYWGHRLDSHGRHLVLRIYIDHSRGVTLDDCSAVSNQLSGVLDVEDAIRQSYTLEVSSPGVERPLLSNEHYELYIGAKIKVKSHIPLNNRKNFIGHLESVNTRSITLKIDNELIDIPHNAIKRGQLLCEDWDYCYRRKNNGE